MENTTPSADLAYAPQLHLPCVDENNDNLRQRRPPPSSSSSSSSSSSENSLTKEEPQQQQQQHHHRQMHIHKRRKRLQWIVSSTVDAHAPTVAQEKVFLEMQLRKMRRRVHGRKVKGTIGCEVAILLVLVFVIFLADMLLNEDAYDTDEGTKVPTTMTNPTSNTTDIISQGTNSSEAAQAEQTSTTGSTTETFTSIPNTLLAVLLILCWLLWAFIILSKAPFSPWWRMLKWMLLYLPLLWAITELAWSDDGTAHKTLMGLYIVAEIIVFSSFTGFYIFYPVCLRKNCFLSKSAAARPSRLWRVKVISDWTMSYKEVIPNHETVTKCQPMHTCKYEGETCPETGLPQGLGRWLDDAWEGEMITGYWKQGQAVAPYSSWSYGTDDAVSAVRVAYFIATDDPFEKNDFFASNLKSTPTCGIASVECSVSGSFYQHLPEATLLEGPYHANDNESGPNCYSNSIRQCIRDLEPISNESAYNEEQGLPTVEIRATDARGVQVVGHIYQPTGCFFANDTDQITVEVNRASGNAHKRGTLTRKSARFSKNMFLPRAEARRSIFGGKIVIVDIEQSDNSDSDYSQVGAIDEEKGIETQSTQVFPAKSVRTSNISINGNRSSGINSASIKNNPFLMQQGLANLRVQNWIPAEHKEALIFIPGYNSCTKGRLQNFGQFLAMSKLATRIYPFLYCWPGSIGPGVFQASEISGTAKNFDNLHKLVASIRAAGIRTVHFMTHSMGAQGLLGALHDEYDANGIRMGRSKFSRCFQLDPSFSETKQTDDSENVEHKLVCKTITLLNPDFPLEAFVDRGFLSIRRICRTVTVIGDRNDRALWWSSLINGLAARRGYQHWDALLPELPRSQKRQPFRLQERVGRSIDSLHFPALNKRDGSSKHLVFQERSSIVGARPGSANEEENVDWLDMDCVDMTGLDSNIAGLRHSGFSLNGMLLKDLEELLTTGKRAMKRSTLVYRDGNMFSYAHAPSFVSW